MTDANGSMVTRMFAVPPEAVFDAWVTPGILRHLVGRQRSRGSPRLCVPGCPPRRALEGHDDPRQGMPEFHWRGEYVEVDRPNKLVLTSTFEPGDARELLTVTVTAVDGGTQMLFSQTGGNLSPEEYEGTTAGWQIVFDAMDSLLTA